MLFHLTPSIYGPLLRFPLYASNFRFSPLLRTIPTIFDPPLPPPYSIPSLVASVVAIAVTEVLVYTSLPLDSIPSILYPRFYTFRSSTFFKTSNAYITAVIVEVLAQISRTIRTRESFPMCALGMI